MQVREVDAEQNSSSSISPPPDSPPNHAVPSDTIQVQPRNYSGGGVVNAAAVAASGTPISTTTSTNGTATEKPKRQRKKKEVILGPDGKPVVDEKPKKPRKPREPKDKTAGANGTATAPQRKKAKTEPKTEPKLEGPIHQDAASTQPRQPTITELVGTFQTPKEPASSSVLSQPVHNNSDAMIRNSLPPHISNPSTPRPTSSGQNYDPIRGSTMDSRPTNQPNGAQAPLSPPHVPPHVNRASASPSIASLIDPPVTVRPSIQTIPHSPTTMQHPFAPAQQSQQSPTAIKSTFAPAPPVPSQASPPAVPSAPAVINMDGAMDMEPTCNLPKAQQPPVPEIKAPSPASSSGPAPKVRPTPEPPKGTGSGLLSSSDLFGGPSSSEPSERKGVNIDIHIPLNPKGANAINIAQEIIKKYGRDAINPRAAAHREQLLRIAAEQERLGGASNDDMSVDLLSEMEGDSNVEMGGMDDEKSNTGLDVDGKPARKRRKKVEEYDKEDDFIDDTELAWQEQAAVAKDGFFVYSGPLVPEGEQAQVESSAPAKGARGRGRGRGGRSTASGTTHASLADKSRTDTTATATAATTSTRSRSTRGRGTGAPRKPRITKAEKERMETEKVDRERTASTMNNSGPTALGTTTNGASTSSMSVGSTPTPTVASAPPPRPHPPLPPSQLAQTQTHTYNSLPILTE